VFLLASELSIIDKLLRELYSQNEASFPDPLVVKSLLRTVGELLFPILNDHLPTSNGRVMFVPSGKWVGVPFHAVEDPNKHTPLDEDYFVGTAPSLASIQRANTAVVVNRGGLLVGDPDGSLPGARNEARLLVRQYGGVFNEPLIGSAANAESVLRRVAQSGWLHFSCHGSFNAAVPSQSVLKLSDGLLSAANLLRAGRGYAGVVLSACEVGRSAADGLDPLGMSGIFLAAGARCVLAPLWSISDAASRQFIELLYRYLASAPLGIAATRARRDLRSISRFENPFYWAAFQTSGAPFHPQATPFSG
jgi:CHAT domain-containing protein